MFERFTNRGRNVMAIAGEEARTRNHEFIGTEHILLGLIKEGRGAGATVLKKLNADIEQMAGEVDKLIKPGPDEVAEGTPPPTPRAKKVVEYALEETRKMKHTAVGTGHLLLGLLREETGVAAQVLANLGVSYEAARKEMLNLPTPFRLQ